MLLSGTLLLRYLHFLTLLRIGLIASALVFGGVIWVGLQENATSFRAFVFVMGIGTGFVGAGMLTGLAHFTTTLRAGLLMGVWGMANLLGRAAGSIMGGSVVGLLQWLTGAPFWGYTTVFALEVMRLPSPSACGSKPPLRAGKRSKCCRTPRLNRSTKREPTGCEDTRRGITATKNALAWRDGACYNESYRSPGASPVTVAFLLVE